MLPFPCVFLALFCFHLPLFIPFPPFHSLSLFLTLSYFHFPVSYLCLCIGSGSDLCFIIHLHCFKFRNTSTTPFPSPPTHTWITTHRNTAHHNSPHIYHATHLALSTSSSLLPFLQYSLTHSPPLPASHSTCPSLSRVPPPSPNLPSYLLPFLPPSRSSSVKHTPSGIAHLPSSPSSREPLEPAGGAPRQAKLAPSKPRGRSLSAGQTS